MVHESAAKDHNPPSDQQFAVLFDVDGVLIDSYDAHFRSWSRLATQEGLEMSREAFASSFGRTSRDIIADHWHRAGRKVTDDLIRRLDDQKEAFYREIIRAEFPAMPYASDLLDDLQRDGFGIGVGSSGPPDNVMIVLEHLGGPARFDAIVTGMDVIHGKPDPEVFLKGAERIGIAAEHCAVVEDAPAGIEAANRAGMVSIAFASSGHSMGDFPTARLIVPSLQSLNPTLIRGLFQPM